MIDTARYYFAVLMVVMFPGALLYWFIVHPFIGFWRRVGVKVTFTFVIIAMVAAMYGLWLYRNLLLGVDYGTNYWLMIIGVPVYVFAGTLDTLAKRHLKLYILVGVPEVAPESREPKLLREGPYGRLRHPRYLAIMIGVVGWSLLVNFMGVYLMLPVLLVGLYLIVLLEERELHDRFGEAYDKYCEEVPRFIPRFGKG